MSDLIESSEFGDWLIGQISDVRLQSKSADSDRALTSARLRLETLKVAKKVLLEYLTHQQRMLNAASAARNTGH